MGSAAVKIEALFRPDAHVKLYKRRASNPLGAQLDDVVAHGVVGPDSRIEIGGLEAGQYWAVVDGQYPVAVTAKGGKVERVTEDRRSRERPTGDGDVRSDEGELVASQDDETPVEGRDGADALVAGDPKVEESPVSSPDVVVGPRTSGNTRLQAKASGTPDKSLTETVKETVKKSRRRRK